MSIESAKVIVEKMEKDQEFAARVSACKSFDELQQVFAKEGLEVTEKELVEQLSTLADDNLEQVAGGGIQHRHLSCNQVMQDILRKGLCNSIVSLAN